MSIKQKLDATDALNSTELEMATEYLNKYRFMLHGKDAFPRNAKNLTKQQFVHLMFIVEQKEMLHS